MSRYSNSCVKGCLKTDGRYFVNEAGETVVLKGFGTGNWQNPEGFMIGAPKMESLADCFPQKEHNYNRFDRRRSVEQVVRELCGSDYLKSFWERWETNHLQEGDIRQMAEDGYNCVRLVLNSGALLYEEPGIKFNEGAFERLGKVLDWCEKYRLYAILDMHAPVGGICGCCGDSLHFDFPSLFFDEESRGRTVMLWEELVRRFGERRIVAGYDLLNEPVSTPPAYYAIPELAGFYREVISRIRKIDRKHTIFLEGANFARGNQIFKEDFDPECHNWCISIHVYGASPEIKNLYPYILKSMEWNVPVWIGESGSDPVSNGIFFDICERLGIGYSIWNWKKAIDGIEPNGVGFHLPEDWELVRSFCAGGARPSYKKAQAIFDEYLENLKIENCTHNEEYRRISAKEPDFCIPGAAYDMFMEDGQRYIGSWLWGNYLNFRMEDHTKLVWASEKEQPYPPFTIYPEPKQENNPFTDLALELSAGEFALYSVNSVRAAAAASITAASPEGGEILCSVNGGDSVTLQLEKCDILKCLEMEALQVPVCDTASLRIEVKKGILQIKSVSFKYL